MTLLTDLHEGDELPPLRLPKISRTTLALYAGASGDHNPIHIDIDAARNAGLDDVFAQGMLSMAYLGRLLTGWVPQDRIRSYSVRFTSITPLHAEPICTGRITAIEDGDGERRARLDLQVALNDGAITLRGQALIALA